MPEWKVLIYDEGGMQVITPLLNVQELRDLGVTLHLPLRSAKDAIPGHFFFPPLRRSSPVALVLLPFGRVPRDRNPWKPSRHPHNAPTLSPSLPLSPPVGSR